MVEEEGEPRMRVLPVEEGVTLVEEVVRLETKLEEVGVRIVVGLVVLALLVGT